MDRAEFEVNPGTGKTVAKPLPRLLEERKTGGNNENSQNPQDSLYNLFLSHLLRPREWSAQNDGNGYFAFRREHILALADEAMRVMQEQPMVLRVDAPIKIFGDIHGQY